MPISTWPILLRQQQEQGTESIISDSETYMSFSTFLFLTYSCVHNCHLTNIDLFFSCHQISSCSLKYEVVNNKWWLQISAQPALPLPRNKVTCILSPKNYREESSRSLQWPSQPWSMIMIICIRGGVSKSRYEASIASTHPSLHLTPNQPTTPQTLTNPCPYQSLPYHHAINHHHAPRGPL